MVPGVLPRAHAAEGSEPAAPARVSPGPSTEGPESEIHDARLAELLRAHFHTVWRAVRRFGVSEDVADDAAQEVFIVAAKKLDTIDAGRELTYLYGIAMRIAANARRAQFSRREHGNEQVLLSAEALGPLPDALLEEKRMRELLDDVLDELPHDLRTAFVLFELEGLSAREIAEVLEIPPGTVASRLRRAREAFHGAAERRRALMGQSGGRR